MRAGRNGEGSGARLPRACQLMRAQRCLPDSTHAATAVPPNTTPYCSSTSAPKQPGSHPSNALPHSAPSQILEAEKRALLALPGAELEEWERRRFLAAVRVQAAWRGLVARRKMAKSPERARREQVGWRSARGLCGGRMVGGAWVLGWALGLYGIGARVLDGHGGGNRVSGWLAMTTRDTGSRVHWTWRLCATCLTTTASPRFNTRRQYDDNCQTCYFPHVHARQLAVTRLCTSSVPLCARAGSAQDPSRLQTHPALQARLGRPRLRRRRRRQPAHHRHGRGCGAAAVVPHAAERRVGAAGQPPPAGQPRVGAGRRRPEPAAAGSGGRDGAGRGGGGGGRRGPRQQCDGAPEVQRAQGAGGRGPGGGGRAALGRGRAEVGKVVRSGTRGYAS